MADHPLAEIPGLTEHLHFLEYETLNELPAPWPRHQEIERNKFRLPTKDDLVLSISHTWHFQGHPDPHDEKRKAAEQAIQRARETYKVNGKTLVFTDFLACPQRPFAPGQRPRTAEEEEEFAKALKLFPTAYLASEATVHIEVPDEERIQGNAEVLEAPLSELDSATLKQIGDTVQIVDQSDAAATCQPLSLLRKIGNRGITSLKDVEKARAELANSAACPFGVSCSGSSCTVEIEHLPFGKQSSLPASVKGWVYLERFISMVKMAMLGEDQAHKVVFSNSEAVIQQIQEGARKLRQAASSDPNNASLALRQVMKEFQAELRSKKFAAISLDKAENTGGTGGLGAGAKEASDADMVEQLMQEMVDHLAEKWHDEARHQLQRQLILGVGRADVKSVRSVLAMSADVHAQDSLGMTCLHLAARSKSPEVVKVLLEHRANCFQQDLKGNSPAHEITLLSQPETLQLMDMLAASEDILMIKNRAGISPVRRFQTWVVTELGDTFFSPAREWLDATRSRFPKAFALDLCSSRSNKAKAFEPRPVTCRTETFTMSGGKSFSVQTWEPAGEKAGEREVAAHVLCLGLSFVVPPCSTRDAVHSIAEYLCQKHHAKFFLLSCDSFDPELWGSLSSFQEVYDAIQDMVQAMPLNPRFVLVDSSLGETTHMTWVLRERLDAALLLNIRGLHSRDFNSSAACQKIQARFQTLHGAFAAKNIDKIVGLIGDYAWAEDQANVEQIRNNFQTALRSSSEAFYKHAAFHCKMISGNIMERTRSYESWSSSQAPHVLLLVGSFSPALWTHEAASHLQALIPEAEVEYIENSKSCWELEGPSQAFQVSCVLSKLLQESATHTFLM